MLDSGLKVAVLAGGVGRERQVSLESGRCVAQALEAVGAEVVVSDIGPENLGVLDDESIDVFFLALHGAFGEDGRLQKILDDRGIVYTGTGARGSRIAFDKILSKKYFMQAGAVCPKAIEFEADNNSLQRFETASGRYVVKPIREGSSFGVSIVNGWDAAVEGAKKCLEQFGDCMIEEFIEGRELTVGILGTEALPVIEIRPKSEFYDFAAKYVDDRTEFVFDTIEAELAKRIQKAATDCFAAIGGKDFGRVDFMLDKDDRFFVLEINTLPGMTSHSLLPKAAKKSGMSMSGLCEKIVELAMKVEKQVVK